MSNLGSHFIFSKSQQNGIFLLVLIIIIFQLVYFFVDFNSEMDINKEDTARIAQYQIQIDSLKQVALADSEVKIYPFNPNLITDYKGYTLGMSVDEIDRLLLFRKSNKWVNSSEEFQKVTLVSDSLLNKISPYFKFPDWVKKSKQGENKTLFSIASSAKSAGLDLNSATLEELISVKGIGEVLATRIIKYRLKIGGFISDLQLKDIYGLNFETRNELLNNFSVFKPTDLVIYSINKASVLEIASVPYLDYELAREIINYRILHERISSFEELAKIKGFPSEKIDRIALYLTLE
ncbi:DNA uptake protein ComE-like DNA-binding protein [Gillisia mitskevichiae]|uniref:DNA uptake protein ComE-like DNA-binding protein n=1 Tax=Gillisia mitskevichiae TaxID=270921 RepID=A0A495PWD6_9FLAO|nr:helix-hairpin-helix domain-containing protein [Gillisia mitskevichiae]RKS53872.1 DNA uptake protein ComE-like DNA-binding protein [Gillisia mitskevichiae]